MTLQIIRREFVRIVFSKGFLISTFGTPLLLLFFLMLALLPTAGKKIKTKTDPLFSFADELSSLPVALLDESNLLTGPNGPLASIDENGRYVHRQDAPQDAAEDILPAKMLPPVFIKVGTLADGNKMLEGGRIKALIQLPGDYLDTRQIFVITGVNEETFRPITHAHEEAVKELIGRTILTANAFPADLQQTVLKGPRFENKELVDGKIEQYDPTRSAHSMLKRHSQRGLHYLLAVIMVMMIFTNSNRLLRSSAEERENKLIDVLLTTVRPEQFIIGKTLGILAASLCQLGLWLGIVVTVASFAIRHLELEMSFNPLAFASSLIFTLLGMLFYGFIYAGAGSFKTDPNEETGLKVFLAVIQLVTFYSLVAFLPTASDSVWNLLSAVPFLMPFLMPFKLAAGELQLTALSLYFVLMALSTFVALKVAARLLRLRCMYLGQAVGELALLKKAFLGQVN